MTDAGLIQRLKDGDVNAIREIMRAYSDKMFTIAEITVGSPDIARDAVQEAFVQLWDKRHTIDPTQNLTGYLATITRRRALDLLRHEQMHGRITDGLSAVYTTGDTASFNEGEQNIDSEEATLVLQRALSELSPRCREIFLLHREAGLSYAEIEKLLGMSSGAVRVQVSRAGAHIGQALRRWMSGS